MSETGDKIRAAVIEQLAALGIKFTAVYVGQVARENGDGSKPWDCDQWRVTFEKRDPTYHGLMRTENCFLTDYFTGLGHREIPAAEKLFLERELKNMHTSRHAAIRARYAKPVAPHAADVLHSLSLDASAANESFADWCDDFGYSSDSISALHVYQACAKKGRDMQRFFGHDTVQAFAELTRDY